MQRYRYAIIMSDTPPPKDAHIGGVNKSHVLTLARMERAGGTEPLTVWRRPILPNGRSMRWKWEAVRF